MLSFARTRPGRVLIAALAGAAMLSLTPLAESGAAQSSRSCDQLCSAVPTVKLWLEYLEDGKSRRAWRLMAEPSRHAIGGFEQFKSQSSAWAEGWGAWAGARNRDFELRVIAPMDDDADSVVTITGLVAQEGPYESGAAALPVRIQNGITEIDPVHGDVLITPVRPTAGQSLDSRPRFKAVVEHIRARSNGVYFIVKGSRLERDPDGIAQAELSKTGHRSYEATLQYPGRLSAGDHVVTIVSWGRDGFKAEAVLFTVDG